MYQGACEQTQTVHHSLGYIELCDFETHCCVLGSKTSQLLRILPDTLFPTVPPQT